MSCEPSIGLCRSIPSRSDPDHSTKTHCAQLGLEPSIESSRRASWWSSEIGLAKHNCEPFIGLDLVARIRRPTLHVISHNSEPDRTSHWIAVYFSVAACTGKEGIARVIRGKQCHEPFIGLDYQEPHRMATLWKTFERQASNLLGFIRHSCEPFIGLSCNNMSCGVRLGTTLPGRNRLRYEPFIGLLNLNTTRTKQLISEFLYVSSL